MENKPVVNNLSAARYVELLEIEKQHNEDLDKERGLMFEFLSKLNDLNSFEVGFNPNRLTDNLDYELSLHFNRVTSSTSLRLLTKD